MIEWLLTGDNLLKICMVIGTISFVISVVLNLRLLKLGRAGIVVSKRSRNIIILFLLNSVLFIGGYFLISRYIIEDEYVSINGWKEVYNKDIGVDINIYIEDEYNIKFISGYNIKFGGGKLLGPNYLYLSKLGENKIEGIILAEKDDNFEKRNIIISRDNIIINGRFDSKSTISKIEYRKIEGTKKKAFGHYGKDIRQYNKDGELRITIDGKKEDKELKKIFD